MVRIKLESNNINFAAETCKNFYFQKQYCELLSLNNKHVGAKLNRDYTIIKNHSETIEICFWKKEKTMKYQYHWAAQRRKMAHVPLSHLLMGPRPDSQRPGRRFGPPRRPLPRPNGPLAGPEGEALSRPLITIGRSSAVFARSKPASPSPRPKP